MNKVIEVLNVKKQYRWEVKKRGFFGVFKSLFSSSYQTVQALNGISFNVEQGEILGLLGPNGAGKSTLFKCLAGIIKLDEGSVTVLGLDSWKDKKKIVPSIGAFFGSKSLMWWNLPVIKTYELMKSLYRITQDDFEEKLIFFEKFMGGKEYLEKPPRQLSFGQRQRAEIITCLLHNPKVVFLDEPTLGLDILAKEQLTNLICEYNQKYGTTFVLSTHDLKDIEKMCSRIIIINKGKIVRDSEAEIIRKEILNNYELIVDFKEKLTGNEIFLDEVESSTDTSVHIHIEGNENNVYKLLEKINKSKEISTFEIHYQTIDDIIKRYYLIDEV